MNKEASYSHKQQNRMRRFLHEPVSSGNQQPEPDKSIEIEGDNDVREIAVEETVSIAAEESCSTTLSENEPNDGPWPYMKTYYKFKSKKDLTLSFQCQLCLPATKMVVCTLKFRNGLKSHCQRSHPLRFQAFKNCLEQGSKRAKKRMLGEESAVIHSDNPTSSKKPHLHQQTLTGVFAARP